MNILKKLLYFPDYIRGYRIGDPNRNGEYKFLRKFLKDKMTIFDIGANIGDYTEYLFKLKTEIFVHCFEPVDETFKYLQVKIDKCDFSTQVKLNKIGMGKKNENKEIFIYGSLSGGNSLYLRDIPNGNVNEVRKINIRISTIDDYVKENSLVYIDFIKIDVEGYEPEVIFGASNSFKHDIINCIQFEYGGTWQNSNYKLTDVLQFLFNYNFQISRLTPWGKIRINRIVDNLNSLKYSNYIAIRK